MSDQKAVALLLRPLSEPLPLPLQQRGCKSLEALEGLNAHEQLQLACRTVLGVLKAARPQFRGDNELVFNAPCDAVLQWLKQEMKPLRFIRPN